MKKWALSMALAVFLGPAILGAADSASQTQVAVHFNLALSLYKKGDLNGAENSLKKALAVAPDHSQANLLLGVVRCEAGRYGDAIEPLNKVLAKDPAQVDALNNLGIAYFQTGRNDEAEKTFNQLVKAAPGRADAYFNLGLLALKKEAWPVAEANFKKAAGLDPKNQKAWLGYADSLGKQGKDKEAAPALAKALQSSPGDENLRLSLARSYYTLGENQKVLETLKPVKDSKEPELYFLLGCSRYRLADFDGSKAAFEKALQLKDDYPQARFNLAITYYDQGNYEAAVEQFEEVLKKHPGDKDARHNLDVTRQIAVQSALKQGSEAFIQEDYLRALKIWTRANKLDPANAQVKELVATAKGQLENQSKEKAALGSKAMKAGKLEAAVSAWSEALEMDPENGEAKEGMVRAGAEAKKVVGIYEKECLAAMGRGELGKASELADKAVKLDASKKALKSKVDLAKASKASSLAASAEAAAKAADLDRAGNLLEQALLLQPENTKIKNRLNQIKVSSRDRVGNLLKDAKKASDKGDTKKAYELYSKVAVLEPGNPEASAGLKAQASAGTKAKEADPTKARDLYYQGVYAYASGDTKKAIELWKQVLVMDPKHEQAKMGLQRGEARLKALAALEKK